MKEKPFVVLIGTHSSGSSVIAGVAYHVGVWLGNRLIGRYGCNPNNRCGFEDRTLSRMLARHVPALCNSPRQLRVFETKLRQRIDTLTLETSDGQIPGGKHPQLSVLGDVFIRILGDRLRVIECYRPLADSTASLQRIWPQRANEVPDIQQWLWDGKMRFLAAVPAEHQLRMEYCDVLKNPLAEAQRIAAWLGLMPTSEQLARAVRIVHPEMQHVGRL